MSREGIIFGAIIALAVGIIVSIIMANFFGAFDQISLTDESREQMEKIENSWKITDIISTIGAILIICLGVFFIIQSRRG